VPSSKSTGVSGGVAGTEKRQNMKNFHKLKALSRKKETKAKEEGKTALPYKGFPWCLEAVTNNQSSQMAKSLGASVS